MNLRKFFVPCLTVVIGMTTLKANASCAPLLDHSVRQLAGERVDRLCEVYQGQVIMIVNTASKCGFTPQFDGLEALYQKYKDKDLRSLASHPRFRNQEYGTEEEAADFCRLTYGVQFPMCNNTRQKAKQTLCSKGLRSNRRRLSLLEFPQIHIGRDGQLVGSFGSFTGPSSRRIARVIEDVL